LNPGYGLTSHFAWKASVLTKLDDDRSLSYDYATQYIVYSKRYFLSLLSFHVNATMSTNENVQIIRIMIRKISILSTVLAVRVPGILRDHDMLYKRLF
jgi:hypothetical protein